MLLLERRRKRWCRSGRAPPLDRGEQRGVDGVRPGWRRRTSARPWRAHAGIGGERGSARQRVQHAAGAPLCSKCSRECDDRQGEGIGGQRARRRGTPGRSLTSMAQLGELRRLGADDGQIVEAAPRAGRCRPRTRGVEARGHRRRPWGGACSQKAWASAGVASRTVKPPPVTSSRTSLSKSGASRSSLRASSSAMLGVPRLRLEHVDVRRAASGTPR